MERNNVATLADCRELGFCSHGLRQFMQDNGIDWFDFLQNGVSIEYLQTLDDENVRQVIEIAKKRINNGR